MLLEVAAVNPRHEADGRSLVPLLRQSGALQRGALYWHYPHYWGGNPVRAFGAVRAGDWKLIEFYEDMRLELYDLKADIGETSDQVQAQPAKAAELRKMLHAWRASVGAQMPTPNPEHRPAVSSKKKNKRQKRLEDQALLLRSAEDWQHCTHDTCLTSSALRRLASSSGLPLSHCRTCSPTARRRSSPIRSRYTLAISSRECPVMASTAT